MHAQLRAGLAARRKRGDRVRVLVAALEMREKSSSSERTALRRLTSAGVEVRVRRLDEG